MYTPQIEPIRTLTLPESKVNYAVIGFFRCIIQLYARAIRFKEPVMIHSERMIGCFRQFQEKKIRLIVGFRHSYGDDPQCMAYTFHHALPKAARMTGKPLRGMTHVHFLYGVEVPFWSSGFVRWLLPNVGAIPVDHIHMDSKGMGRIRKIISEGEYPLALAPEGHVTYGSERIVELETGTARFGFWCMEDLARAQREERVVFLPVSTFYRYGRGIEKKLASFIAKMETECGITARTKANDDASPIAERLRAIGLSILAQLAEFYSEMTRDTADDSQPQILEAALRSAERIFAIEPNPEDKPMTRLYRIRSIGWDRIYRNDIDEMTDLRRELADRESGEAWFAMRHMETVELLIYIDLTGVKDSEPIERYVEIANNFSDFIERQKGGTLKNRANAFDKYAIIAPGKPIMLNDYLDLYKKDKKAALQKATDDMRAEYETSIKEYQDEYR